MVRDSMDLYIRPSIAPSVSRERWSLIIFTLFWNALRLNKSLECARQQISPIIKCRNHGFNKILIISILLTNNSSLKFEIKAKQFYAASQRVL